MAFVFGLPGQAAIPYPSISLELMAATQKLIPFLGAGASLAGGDALLPSPPASSANPAANYAQVADATASQLGLSGKARDFLTQAIRQACELQAFETQPMAAYQKTAAKPIPPSARELADALAAIATYEGAWPYSLLAVSSYHEFVRGDRDTHWTELHNLFAAKVTPLPTHHLIAKAARHHLRNSSSDYLIMTTNYDQLIERALDTAHVPYCVLTVDRNDGYVDVAFSDTAKTWLQLDDAGLQALEAKHLGKYPVNFTLSKDKPLAIVYKIHGCLFPRRQGRDSIILSDEDYIEFLRRQGTDGAGIVPASVLALMQSKGFLFLGYSFSDWNIRSIFKSTVKQRSGGKSLKDYAVVSGLSAYESAYFTDQNIRILIDDLVDFVNEIQEAAPPAAVADTPALL